MQIRRILLISYFILLIIATLALTTLAFFSSKEALQEEIGRNLTSDAAMLLEEVDLLMFERLQNVHSWSHLSIIQEARIGDVDKQLSKFLTDVALGYKGMYRSLFYVDKDQHIIAANSPELIGLVHYTTANWVKAEIPGGEVFIEDLQLSSPPYDDTNLVIRAPVLDNYSAENIGHLYGVFDMGNLFRLLDKASRSSSGSRYVVLLDAEGRTIAASSKLRKPQFLLKNTFGNWKPPKGETLFVHAGNPVATSSVLVGYAGPQSYAGYVPMGWSILILQSTDQAFLPIHTLLNQLSIVILLVMILTFMVAHWISGRITKPLLELTKWVRHMDFADKSKLPGVGGTVEIRQLEKAFGEMLRELEHSRGQVVQSAKLAVVGEMAAIMAHEVRTPLGILSTSAQMLQKEQQLSPEGQEMTQFILDESARLRKLVTTLLECARPREPHMLQCNIHDIVSHTVDILATQSYKKQLHIEQQLLAQYPIIVCDAELLTQVFLNLLMNAIQIVPEQGFIHISSSVYQHYVRIEIADNGPGIAEADYPYLFDPFFTKRSGGIGLGLTVTKQIVLAHHGELSAGPSQWGGACFTLTLPISQK